MDSRISDKTTTEKPARQNPETADPNIKSAIVLNDNVETRKEVGILAEKSSLDIPKIIAEEPAKLESVETVPERILKLAETIKEEGDINAKTIIVEVKEEVAKSAKEEKSEHPNA